MSLDDFADQVTVSGEVAKAIATWIYDGLDLGVHLTVAGQLGALFSAQALRDLGVNLKAVRDPNHRLVIANYVPVYVTFRVGDRVDPAYDSDAVVEAVRQAAIRLLRFRQSQPGAGGGAERSLSCGAGCSGRGVRGYRRIDFQEAGRDERVRVPGLPGLAGCNDSADGAAETGAGPAADFSGAAVASNPGVVLPAELAALQNPG